MARHDGALVPKSVHVVHCVYSFHVGGLEKIIANSIKGLPDYYQHTIITLTSASNEFLATLNKDIKVIELNKPSGHSWRVFYDVYQHLKQLNANVFHTYNLASIEYQVCAFLVGVPVRVHAEHGRDLADPDGSNAKYRIIRRCCKPFIHKFVAVSHDLYKWLDKTVGLGPSKVMTILNGVDTDEFRAVIRDEDDSILVYGHVARLEGIKNQALMINAYAQACANNQTFLKSTKLVLVGDGGQRKALETLVASFELTLPITFDGVRYDMPSVYQEFDVFVLSSDAEGIPMTMLEAMATELPVVSTSVGGIPEVLDEHTGYLTPAKDKDALTQSLLRVFERRAELKKMGQCARQTIIERFSQLKMLNEYMKLYERR